MKKLINHIVFALFFCCLSFGSGIQAQDIHFSQNYATPLFINPGMTGLMNGDFRASIVYRNQWASVLSGQPFRTIYGAADMSLPMGENYNRLAFGLMLYNDRGGELGFQTNYGDIALAYNVGLSERAFLSVGLEAGLAQRGFDGSAAQFGSQYEGGFNPLLPSGENLTSQSQWSFNAAAGAVFSLNFAERNNVYFGGGFYHLTQPDLSFNSNVPDELYSKLSIQAGGSVALGEHFDLVPSLYFLKQGPHSKLDGGAFARYIFRRDRRSGLERAASAGTFVRIANNIDALVLAGKLEYDGFGLGLSYDVTMSDLAIANGHRGGVEIALTYTARLRTYQRSRTIQCPKF